MNEKEKLEKILNYLDEEIHSTLKEYEEEFNYGHNGYINFCQMGKHLQMAKVKDDIEKICKE